MNQKITVRTLREYKARSEKILMLTAFDACTAAWAEAAGVPTILVGDSMGNTVLGYPNTLPVTLEESLAHTAAVRRGAPNAFVIGDMPGFQEVVAIADLFRLLVADGDAEVYATEFVRHAVDAEHVF